MLKKNMLKGYDNTELRTFNDINLGTPNTYEYDRLGDSEVSGVLKACLYVDGKLIQTYTPQENHVGVVAATRLGKTTSYAIPTIVSFARQKRKKSMIISDPKGELYRNTAATLRSEGYTVRLLNFRDYLHSECWNPLTPIFRKYTAALRLTEQVELIETENGPRNRFRGKVYESQKELDAYVERIQNFMFEDVGSDIESYAAMVCPTESEKDPYWEDSARELMKAFLWAMLEDSTKDENRITEETFSFSTLAKIMASINDGNGATFEDGGYFSDRGLSSRAFLIAKSCIIDNGHITRKCILSVFNSKIAIFKESAMRLITSCNTFEMSELSDSDKPVAIFIDYRDELKVHYKIISLFVQAAYTHLISHANAREGGKLEVPFYFILDEFGNFPPIPDFETVISACGGRNIFFILILQSYAQLENVYRRGTAEIIRDNLNVHVFFGSNNPATLREFSEECGKLTRISPMSALVGKGADIEQYSLETIPLMPTSRLAKLEPGECVITEANSGYVLFSKLTRYFMCDEFKDLPLSKESEYTCDIDPLDEKYSYTVKLKERSGFDF